MPDFKLPLSGDLTQSINPWAGLFNPTGSQFGLLDINLRNSSDTAVESQVISDVASDGKQLGTSKKCSFVSRNDGNSSSLPARAKLLSGIRAASIIASVICGPAAQADTGTVPFVGCASDGQMGPVPAPSSGTAIPNVPASVARRLAYYSSRDLGVLAPRGWHCFGLYGSNGQRLIVTPEPRNAKDLLTGKGMVHGPAAEVARAFGGTSGRFQVAEISAQLFPIAKPFVQRVVDEGFVPKENFPEGPSPTDSLSRRSDTEVEYMTPAGKNGIGTFGRLAPNGEPISGVAILLPKVDMDVVKLDVRLPSGLRDLAAVIIATVEQNLGDVTAGGPG